MNSHKLNVGSLALVVALSAGSIGAAQAQNEEILSNQATSDDIRDRLIQMSAPPSMQLGKARGIRPGTTTAAPLPDTPPIVVLEETQVPDAPPPTLSLLVYFPYDSDRLTDRARMELDKLGQAMADPALVGKPWVIEGHTDASGSANYNQSLSEQRAGSVRRYLVDSYGIASRDLRAVGLGETELYDERRPESELNRRVRIKYDGR